MDIKTVFTTTNQALTDLVADIKPEQLTLQMPAYAGSHDGQTLRETLNILAYENWCVPKVLAGETGLASNTDFKDDLLGDDYLKNYLVLSKLANDSVREHQDLERIVHISYGDFPAKSFLTDISVNRCLALYDIAALTGLDSDLPDDIIQGLYDICHQYASVLRQMGIFQPEIKVSEAASAEDELLALIGRQPKDPSVVVA
jgi:hypothetical protein